MVVALPTLRELSLYTENLPNGTLVRSIVGHTPNIDSGQRHSMTLCICAPVHKISIIEAGFLLEPRML